MSNQAIQTLETSAPIERFSAFSSIANFENAQRMAKVLCSSSIVPQTYRENIADAVIALEMANRIGANPLAVMQNLYIVHGRPAWSSQFLISCVNASGKFTPLRYKSTGERGGDSWGCVAWAMDRSGERLESPEVNIAMAKAEGWFQKNGSKWKTMPDLMLRYRAATLFARLFAPELTMGLHCDDEVIDLSPVVTDPVLRAKPAKVEPQFTTPAKDANDAPPGAEMPTVEPAKPATQSPVARDLKTLRALLKPSGFSENHLLNLWRENGVIEDSLSTIDEVGEVKPSILRAACEPWQKTLDALKASVAKA